MNSLSAAIRESECTENYVFTRLESVSPDLQTNKAQTDERNEENKQQDSLLSHPNRSFSMPRERESKQIFYEVG